MALAVLAYLAPSLVSARDQLGFPSLSFVSGIPVAGHGIYFFSVAALVACGLVAYVREAGLLPSLLLAVSGLAAFECLYAAAYALSTGRLGLLVPHGGLPATGWAGFGTWFVVEILVAGFALLWWDRASVDRALLAAGTVFLVGLAVWGGVLGWRYPPYDNSPVVYLVNTVTEVSGSLLVPLLFTGRPRTDADLLRRAWRRIRRAPAPFDAV